VDLIRSPIKYDVSISGKAIIMKENMRGLKLCKDIIAWIPANVLVTLTVVFCAVCWGLVFAIAL